MCTMYVSKALDTHKISLTSLMFFKESPEPAFIQVHGALLAFIIINFKEKNPN